MILIFSDEYDTSTDDIVQYLVYYGVRFIRINNEFSFENIEISQENEDNTIRFSVSGRSEIFEIGNRSNTIVWYRRGIYMPLKIQNSESYNDRLVSYLEEEKESVVRYLFAHPSVIGNYFTATSNLRLYNSMVASKIGFRVPKTLVTSSKSSLLEFIDICNNGVITKPIHRGHVRFKDVNEVKTTKGTFLIREEEIEKMNDSFESALFQECIEKEFEVRAFYFLGDVFAQAIFSQKNEKTRVDYRNFDFTNPNRIVPFSLPESLVSKINDFMDLKGEQTGSFDFIVEKDTNNFHFLEVNLVGMFGYNSRKSNMYIAKNIAKKIKEICHN